MIGMIPKPQGDCLVKGDYKTEGRWPDGLPFNVPFCVLEMPKRYGCTLSVCKPFLPYL
jgi:hypothetical protein